MGLFRLLNELLNTVARSLIPQIHTALGADSLDSSVKEGRRALLTLVKSCRKLNIITTPHLYHTVYITNLGGLFNFLSVLVFNNHLTDLVRVLNITAPLNEYLNNDLEEKSKVIFRRLTPEIKAYTHLTWCFRDFDKLYKLTYNNHNNYTKSAYALILSLMPRLEALYMQVPDHHIGEYKQLIKFFKESY